MAWAWARWCETRRFYGPSAKLTCVLGRLRTSRSTAPGRGPNSFTSAQLMRFHHSITGEEELARACFEGYYLLRVKPIKLLASALDVDRTHVYRLRAEVARRAYARTHADG